jgi:predicted transcriptional regulator
MNSPASSASSSFSSADDDTKTLNFPSYSQVRPHLVQPAKDLIKVINAVCPKIGPGGVSLGCAR